MSSRAGLAALSDDTAQGYAGVGGGGERIAGGGDIGGAAVGGDVAINAVHSGNLADFGVGVELSAVEQFVFLRCDDMSIAPLLIRRKDQNRLIRFDVIKAGQIVAVVVHIDPPPHALRHGRPASNMHPLPWQAIGSRYVYTPGVPATAILVRPVNTPRPAFSGVQRFGLYPDSGASK